MSRTAKWKWIHKMEILKHFFDCYFNQSFGFDELNERINDFKKGSLCRQQLLGVV